MCGMNRRGISATGRRHWAISAASDVAHVQHSVHRGAWEEKMRRQGGQIVRARDVGYGRHLSGRGCPPVCVDRHQHAMPAAEAWSSAIATVALATPRAARRALRRVLTLSRFGRCRPVRIGRLATAAIGIETADVFAKRRLVHVQHVAPTAAVSPGRVGTHKQQQETVTKSGTHLGSATAPGPEWGRLARDAWALAGCTRAIRLKNDCTGSAERASTEKVLMPDVVCNRL